MTQPFDTFTDDLKRQRPGYLPLPELTPQGQTIPSKNMPITPVFAGFDEDEPTGGNESLSSIIDRLHPVDRLSPEESRRLTHLQNRYQHLHPIQPHVLGSGRIPGNPYSFDDRGLLTGIGSLIDGIINNIRGKRTGKFIGELTNLENRQAAAQQQAEARQEALNKYVPKAFFNSQKRAFKANQARLNRQAQAAERRQRQEADQRYLQNQKEIIKYRKSFDQPETSAPDSGQESYTPSSSNVNRYANMIEGRAASLTSMANDLLHPADPTHQPTDVERLRAQHLRNIAQRYSDTARQVLATGDLKGSLDDLKGIDSDLQQWQQIAGGGPLPEKMNPIVFDFGDQWKGVPHKMPETNTEPIQQQTSAMQLTSDQIQSYADQYLDGNTARARSILESRGYTFK